MQVRVYVPVRTWAVCVCMRLCVHGPAAFSSMCASRALAVILIIIQRWPLRHATSRAAHLEMRSVKTTPVLVQLSMEMAFTLLGTCRFVRRCVCVCACSELVCVCVCVQ